MLAFLSLLLSLCFTVAPPIPATLDAVAAPPCAVAVDDADPIVWLQVTPSGNVLCLRASGTFTNAGLIDGAIVESTSARVHAFDFDEPTLTTSWKDAQGGTHTVTTPIVGTTPAARKRCIELHEELVRALQALHPPIVP